MKVFAIFFCLVAATTAAPQSDKSTPDVSGKSSLPIIGKAPSNLVNYGCQCDNYAWTDKNGYKQGNCKSADNTNARWCYIKPGSSCSDIRCSKDRRLCGLTRQWSYEACATPAVGNNYNYNNNQNYNYNYHNQNYNSNNCNAYRNWRDPCRGGNYNYNVNNNFNNNNNGFSNNNGNYNNGFSNNNGNYNNGRPNRRPSNGNYNNGFNNNNNNGNYNSGFNNNRRPSNGNYNSGFNNNRRPSNGNFNNGFNNNYNNGNRRPNNGLGGLLGNVLGIRTKDGVSAGSDSGSSSSSSNSGDSGVTFQQ